MKYIILRKIINKSQHNKASVFEKFLLLKENKQQKNNKAAWQWNCVLAYLST